MRVRSWLATSVAGLTLLGATPIASAQDDEPPPSLEPVPHDQVTDQFDIDDGSYVGGTMLGGAFWLEAGEGVLLVWQGTGTGPMEFTVSDGSLSGTWSMEGSASITGYGFPVTITGTNEWTGSGSISGSNPYMLSGSGVTTSEVSAGGQTSGSTSDYTIAAVPLQDIVQVCDQVTGNWDQAIDDGLEDTPLDHALRTYFVVFATERGGELADRADDLLERATEIQQDLARPPRRVLSDIGGLLTDAETLLSDMGDHPQGCPPDPSFMRILTQMVADIANTYLNQWTGEPTTPSQIQSLAVLVSVGLRAGAMGSGAASAATSELLQAKAEQILQRQFDDVTGSDPMDADDLSVIAVTATLLDYTFDTGITGPDICVLLEEC